MLPTLALSLALIHSACAAPTRLASFATTNTSATTTNGSLPFVCTPSECLQGQNSLTAGVFVDVPSNSTTQQIALLPGTYTPATFTSLTNSSSVSPFNKKSTSTVSSGFSSSGSLSSSSSSFTISLLPGLTAYSSPLYEGTASYLPVPNATSTNSTSATLTNSTGSSFLLSSSVWAILSVGSSSSSSRIVAWDSIPDIGAINGGGSSVAQVVEIQGAGCATPCASGGTCLGNGTCACAAGWTGNTCNACATGFYGRSCEACPAGCTNCDDGITGSGLCLDATATNITLASDCNCINGVCASNSTTATCSCNAGWSKAANGTQCAACASGYYMTSSGDCLACDPSCESCSSPSGTCLTCQTGLQPLSTDATQCTTATTATSNGTFVTCAARTFFDTTTAECVDCNPLCETCFETGATGCLECRTPNVLLNGQCVAMDSSTGVCDGSEASNATVASNAGWVYDNTKGVCDALPAKCTAGAIDNFTSSSTRSQLTCSACLAGTFLVDGACVDACPTGTTVSSDGLSCESCDSSCATCSGASTYCTSCSTSSQLVLNGTCISSCPTGYFAPASNSSTCLACHPDCETCGPTFDACLTCPSARPVLSSSGTCLVTCARTEYYDTAEGECVACDSECATCSGAGASSCLSCNGDSRLRDGSCVSTAADGGDGCSVIEGFGVCLEDLVTVEAKSEADETKKRLTLPWWTILLIVLGVLALVVIGFLIFRRKEQKRRRLHTAKFANELGNKEVDKKLATLPVSIAYPPVPRTHSPVASPAPLDLSSSYAAATHEIPLTPRFVLEDPASPVSPSASSTRSHPPPPLWPTAQHLAARPRAPSRWSASSYGSSSKSATARPLAALQQQQETGGSFYSQRTFTTAAGNTLVVNSKNPYFRKAAG
ncbi:hypothetical protein JCM5296_004259 [Sporobolomyces johnsonii]